LNVLDVIADLGKGDRRRPPIRTRSWQRSLAKTLTWRLFATLDTFVISVLVTGSLRWAGSIVGVEIFTKMALYFVHERAWAWTGWGARPASSPADHRAAT
jgi:uncharacterized membrane protein